MEDSSREQILQSEQHEGVENFKILKTENGEQVKLPKSRYLLSGSQELSAGDNKLGWLAIKC